MEALYFNPLFVSPSNHKYDTQDYDHIDPHLTVIPEDKGRLLYPTEADNRNAERLPEAHDRSCESGSLRRLFRAFH